MSVSDKATQERLDMLHSVKEIAYMLALVGAAVALAVTGHETLAATAMGGAISPVLNRTTPVKVPAVALGIVFGAATALAGCGASFPTVATLVVDGVEWTCKGAVKLCDVLDSERHNDACRIARESCAFVGVSSETTTTTE